MIARALAAGLFALAGCFEPALAGSVATPTTTTVGPLVDTFVIWGDTQSIVEKEQATPLASGQNDVETLANWACNRKATSNIKAVLGVGDIVENGNDAGEWAIFNQATALLDACGLPYLPTLGNHDFTPTTQRALVAADATLYHQNQGQDVLDAKGWWSGRGFRPDFEELHPATGAPLYLEAAGYKSRSFSVSANARLRFLSMEWEGGIRLARVRRDGGRPTELGRSHEWVVATMRANPASYFVVLTHAGPCGVLNCTDLVPEDLSSAQGADPGHPGWAGFLEASSPNLAAVISGHWNRTTCQYGAGTFRTATRDDGTRWLSGMFDFSCPTREDPSGGAFAENPYTWQGWLVLKRDARQLCLRTVRMLDVDNAGVPRDPAIEVSGEFDRNSPAGAACAAITNDSAPNDCPNEPETCMTLYDLPGPG